MNKYVALSLFSLICGALLAAFSLIPDLSRYIFSIVALFAGIKFFGQYSSVKIRIAFVLLSIVVFLLCMVIYVSLAIVNDWYIPGYPDEAVQ